MGKPISQLDPLTLPLRDTDLVEVSRQRASEPDRYDSYKCPAEALSVVQATTTLRGIAELATNQETIVGTDNERAIVPSALWAAIDDVLQNRIVAGAGISLSYVPGSLTLIISAS